MGIVLSHIYALWNSLVNGSKDVKIIIVGLDNSGKTTILYKMRLGQVVSTMPTIGSNVETVTRGRLHMQCWDLGGQDNLRLAWETYFLNTNGVVLVVDASDRDRMGIVRKELTRLLSHEDLKPAALLVLANKQDIKGAMTAVELSTVLSLSDIKDRPWHIQGTCALTGDGLEEGFEWMKETLLSM